MIKSPCVNICTSTSLGDKHCRGCGRTEEDVIKWNSYNDDQKREALKRVKLTEIGEEQ